MVALQLQLLAESMLHFTRHCTQPQCDTPVGRCQRAMYPGKTSAAPCCCCSLLFVVMGSLLAQDEAAWTCMALEPGSSRSRVLVGDGEGCLGAYDLGAQAWSSTTVGGGGGQCWCRSACVSAMEAGGGVCMLMCVCVCEGGARRGGRGAEAAAR